jgi:hypothetical protein
MKDQLTMSTITEVIGKPITNNPNISSPFYCPSGGLCEENILIQLNDYETLDLFQPTVSAYYTTTDEGRIVVDAFALIPHIDQEINFTITQQFVFSESGQNQLNIYINYDYLGDHDTVPKDKYIPLKVSFQTDPVIRYIDDVLTLVEIECLQTFLVNEDPRTSRGTVTTVKKPM